MIIELTEAEAKDLDETEAEISKAKDTYLKVQNVMRQKMLFIVKQHNADAVKSAEYLSVKKVIVVG